MDILEIHSLHIYYVAGQPPQIEGCIGLDEAINILIHSKLEQSAQQSNNHTQPTEETRHG